MARPSREVALIIASEVTVSHAEPHHVRLRATPLNRVLQGNPVRSRPKLLSVVRFPVRVEAPRETNEVARTA